MMYIAKKVEYLLKNIEGHKNCLVFVEQGIEVSEELKRDNCFIFSENVQYEYVKFANRFDQSRRESEKNRKYTFIDGYYVGENVEIGENAFIEPGVVIGHDDHLHNNVLITAGGIVAGFVNLEENSYMGVNSSIRNSITLGDNCTIGMGAVVTKSVDANTTVVGNPVRKFNK